MVKGLISIRSNFNKMLTKKDREMRILNYKNYKEGRPKSVALNKNQSNFNLYQSENIVSKPNKMPKSKIEFSKTHLEHKNTINVFEIKTSGVSSLK